MYPWDVVVPQEEDKQRDKVGKGVWVVSFSIDVVSLFLGFLVLVVLSTLPATAIELRYIFRLRTPPAGEYALDECSTTWGPCSA